jgi:signal transduction histidine kinase
MPHARSATRPQPFFQASIVAGWVLFTLMVIAISWTGSVLRGRPSGLGGLMLWNLGWLLWAAATFVVVRFTRRFPLERKHLGRAVATHIFLGIGVSVGILLLEFVLNHAIERLWPEAPRANAFLGYFVYKFHVYFLIYWMIVGATRAFDLHSQYRQSELLASQLESQLAQTQLLALKAQLQPHFLFNTHHTIISLMLKQDTATAIRMLTRLSDLLRLTLRTTDRQFSSLHDELDALELYLGIQRERYGARLEVEFDIDPATQTADVPWLIFQPLVENALKHGIDPLTSGGRLRIQTRADSGQLQLLVSDNGSGFPADFDPTRGPGIGLRNTHARLARLYSGQYQLRFGRGTLGGAEVRIVLPLRSHAPQGEPLTAVPSHG